MSGTGLDSLQQLRRAVHETVAGEREQPLQQTTGLARRTQQHQLRDHTHCCHDDRVVVRLEAGEVGGQEGLHGTEKVKVHADSTNTSRIVTLWVRGLWPQCHLWLPCVSITCYSIVGKHGIVSQIEVYIDVHIVYYLGDSLRCLSSRLWAREQLVGSGSRRMRHNSGYSHTAGNRGKK